MHTRTMSQAQRDRWQRWRRERERGTGGKEKPKEIELPPPRGWPDHEFACGPGHLIGRHDGRMVAACKCGGWATFDRVSELEAKIRFYDHLDSVGVP